MPEERKGVHAYISDKAQEGIQRFAEEAGVSVTGLLERMFLDVAEEYEAGIDPIASRKDLVTGGRKIDALRRRRGGVTS